MKPGEREEMERNVNSLLDKWDTGYDERTNIKDLIFHLVVTQVEKARDEERERAKEYLRKICWTEKEIEMFARWQIRNKLNQKGE